MELIVLGSCGTYPTAGGACSGYLVRHEGFTLWMDAGHGTLSALQRHVPVGGVDAVFISHAHPDHFVDLYPFFYSLFLNPNERGQVPIYGPPSAEERIGRLLSKPDGAEDFSSILPWKPFNAGEIVEIGPLRLTGFDSVHSCTNVALRIEAGGKAIAYTGDSGPHPDLERAAAGADLFLCEASWLDDDHAIPDPIHMRARQAGRIAEAAGVRHLVLTHVWPHNSPDRVREQAAAAFPGKLGVAASGDHWAL